MEAPNINAAQTTGFSKVFVSGEKMTFSGGPNNRMQTQDISIHKCVASISTPSKLLRIQKMLVDCKGQLISKCPLGVIVSTKIPTKKFDNFCPGI